MWPGMCGTEREVALPAGLQRVRKGLFGRPAWRIVNPYRAAEEHRALHLQRRSGYFQNSPAYSVHPGTEVDQLGIPGRQVPASRLECGVALLQRPAVGAPAVQVVWFHVERDPVQVAPALVRATADKIVDIRDR